jgi:tetratricopeptide (TPR) repeat protein
MPPAEHSIESILAAAVEIGAEAERRQFVDQACAGDAERRRWVEELIANHFHAGSFLEQPAASPVMTVDGQLLSDGPGTVIGPYKLMEQIGEGGMGLVFVAEQQQPLRRKVALKVIKPGMDTRQVVARFEAERQALALMDHPNIARVLDGGQTTGGRPYFVMELVKGVPITDYCDHNQVPIRQRLELFLHVCQAVQHAHQKGIIHRDLKPSNVLVMSQDGTPLVKVIDFGIAKAVGQQLTDKTIYTQFAQAVGTPLYMSPEQAGQSGVDVDTRSDIYSLGVVLYELLTGTTPFDKDRLKEVGYDELRRIIREEEPAKPSTRISTLGQAATTISANRRSEPKQLSRLFRGELDWIVMKALEKDRGRRYETASAFAADVERYLHDEPVLACPPSAAYRFRKFARRNKGRLAVAASAFLAVAVMAAAVGWAVRDRAAREAEIERAEAGRRGEVERRGRDCLREARALLAENKLAAARQKLAEARAGLADDRPALGELAAEVEAVAVELDRFQEFLGLVERAHEAETASIVEMAVAAGSSPGRSRALPSADTLQRQAAAAAVLRLRALRRFGILERDDWNTALEGSLLGREQIKQVRRTAYEELLWLADDVSQRRQDCGSGAPLSPQAAARQAVTYLGKAESAYRPTGAFYQLRLRCRKALGEEAAYQADWQLFHKTPATIALDHHLQGRDAFQRKQLAEAVQAFEAALRLEPTAYWSLVWLGRCLTDLGRGPEDFTGAVRVYTGCILKRPDHAYAYLCRASALYYLRRHEEALADCCKAIELDRKSAEAWNNRGCAYLELRQYDKALAALSKAIKLDPKFAPAHSNLGVALAEQDKLDEAIACFRQAIKLDPKVALAHSNLGNALAEQGKLDEAIAAHRQAITLDPKFAPAHSNLGIALAEQGKLDEAIAAHRQAITLDPKFAPAHTNLGVALFMQRKLDEAIACYRQAIKLDPKNAPAHTNLGNALKQQGKLDEAIAAHRRAIKLDPKLAAAHNNLGIALYKQGKLDEAIACYRQAIKLAPKYAQAHNDLARAHNNLGVALSMQGKLDEAIACYRQAIKLDPKYARAHNNLARAERLAAVQGKLPAFLKGEYKPRSSAERLALAELCGIKKLHHAGAGLYAEAFTADPKLADDLKAGHRYNAACHAALAGCGQGTDADKLDDQARARWRNQALAWLRGDLALRTKQLASGRPDERQQVASSMQHWQRDRDFVGVRGKDGLAKLPASERAGWQQLWAEVQALLEKASAKPPTRPGPAPRP